MKHYCTAKDQAVRNALIALGWTPPPSMPNDEHPPEQSPAELESGIILDELTGKTNKSPEAISRDLERSILSNDPAPRLAGEAPKEITEVAIPFSVKDALSEAIADGKLPLHPEIVSWMEGEVAKYNGASPDTIAATHFIIAEGKCWKYYPELAAIRTGFCYYPPEQ